MTDELDRIERSIAIDATAETVWELVARPAWWIGEGDLDPEPALEIDDDVATLTHPQWGRFRVRIIERRPPTYVPFRWISGPEEVEQAAEETDHATMVEFFVEPAASGVVLRVVESGFAALTKSADRIADHIEENTRGWEDRLAAAERFVSGSQSTPGTGA